MYQFWQIQQSNPTTRPVKEWQTRRGNYWSDKKQLLWWKHSIPGSLVPLATFQNGTVWNKITNKLWRQCCLNQMMNYQLFNYDLILDSKFPYLTRRWMLYSSLHQCTAAFKHLVLLFHFEVWFPNSVYLGNKHSVLDLCEYLVPISKVASRR